MPNAIGICRHCQERRIQKSRRLCCRCFKNLAIREQYPPLKKMTPPSDHSILPPPPRIYPDLAARVACPHGGWDECCVECERMQRAGVVIAGEESSDGD